MIIVEALWLLSSGKVSFNSQVWDVMSSYKEASEDFTTLCMLIVSKPTLQDSLVALMNSLMFFRARAVPVK
ncbi:hypothetical protein CMV_020333 [Castanea mollissima]|uniref:Uncharacterized protein n=1 Tax=Castanea mollissima TaxID=60419 RepID=A0A8J4QZ56_9ROSI|nr:hypothetical protein CMV_020333 [Castanea mollissima]